jgi:hypothetical protein
MSKKKKKKKFSLPPAAKFTVACILGGLIFLGFANLCIRGSWPFDWGGELIEATIVVEDTEYIYRSSGYLRNSNDIYYNSEKYHLFKPFHEDTFKVGDELSIVYIETSFPHFTPGKLIIAVSSADKTYLELEDTLLGRKLAFAGMVVITSIFLAMYLGAMLLYYFSLQLPVPLFLYRKENRDKIKKKRDMVRKNQERRKKKAKEKMEKEK